MSATITTTINPTQAYTEVVNVTLIPRLNIRNEMEKIIKAMLVSHLFDDKEIALLSTWLEKFSDSGAINRIAYFLCVYVRPKTESALTRCDRKKLREFEEKTTNLLIKLLPSNKCIKEFVSDFELQITNATLFYQKFRFIIDVFQKLNFELAALKHEMATEIYQTSQLLNQHMLELNRERSQISQEQHQRIDALTQELTRFNAERVTISQDVQMTAQRLITLNNRLKDISAQCLKLAQQ